MAPGTRHQHHAARHILADKLSLTPTSSPGGTLGWHRTPGTRHAASQTHRGSLERYLRLSSNRTMATAVAQTHNLETGRAITTFDLSDHVKVRASP